MKNSKLSELFWGFSDKSYKKAREFLSSPYFNKNPNFVLLLEHIETFKNSEFPENEDFQSFIVKKNLCEENNVRVFISQFTKLVQLFLETEELNKRPVLRRTFLLNVLNGINAQKSFNMILNETKKQQQETFTKDEDYYYNQMYIELEELNHKMIRDNYQLNDNIKNVSVNLDHFFILSKLNLLHFASHYQKDLSSYYDTDIWLRKEMEKFLSKEYETLKKDHPVIYAKYLILLTISKPADIKNYYKLKEFTIMNSGRLNIDALDYIFTALMNYAITRINNDDEAFSKEMVELFYLMERFEIINDTTSIDYIVFLNIISTFIARNDVDKAEEFFGKYKGNVIPFFKEDTSNLALAAIEFSRGNREEAIKLLNIINYKNYYFYLRSKTLLSKILFDSGEFESIHYLCDATKHYLKRNKDKISQSLFRLYNSYFSLADKLVNLKLSQSSNLSVKKQDLLKMIRKEKLLTSRAWLVEKTKHL
jgi:hypothetical protein